MAEQHHVHQPAWFWAGAAVVAAAVAVGTVYGDRASHFSAFAAPMVGAYALAALAIVCLIGGIRGWRFPFSRHPAAPAPQEPKTIGIMQTGGTADHKNLNITGVDKAIDHRGGHLRTRDAQIDGQNVEREQGEGEGSEEEGGQVHPA